MNWFYSKGEERLGPVTTEALRELVDRGEVDATSLVWNETLDGWKRLTEVDLADGAAQVLCSECGRSFEASETVEFEGRRVCAECKPNFVQRVREGALAPSHMRYGGFWIRFLAKMLDGLILFAINFVIMLPIIGLMDVDPNTGEPSSAAIGATCLLYLLQIAAAVAYEAGFVGAKGATPGKMVCGLKVVTADGGRVSYPRAVGRYFATILSGMILAIGYIIAAFDDEKRTLHDHICTTRVIRT